jgi:hypothetical protein
MQWQTETIQHFNVFQDNEEEEHVIQCIRGLIITEQQIHLHPGANAKEQMEGAAIKPMHEIRAELNSHTDTCIVGLNALIVQETLWYMTVSPFTEALGTMDHVPIVSAAIAYNNPETGEVICLVIYQGIYIEVANNMLPCPMQMKVNDLRAVGKNPKFLTENPTDVTHAISFMTEELIIPLFLHG